MNRKLFNLVIILLILSSGIIQAQDRVRYTAIPKEGYRFVGWEDGNVDSVRIVPLSPIPDSLSGIPLISVSNPSTNRVIRLADQILTSTRGIVLQEVLDGNTNNPLTSMNSSVNIPAIKARFYKQIGDLYIDDDNILVLTKYFPCENADKHFNFRYVPSGDVTIDSKTFTTNYDYYMLEHEVTQRMWMYVMGCGNNPSNWTGENRPVEKVSWYDALVFCNRLSDSLGLKRVYSISGDTNEANWGPIPTSNNSTWNAVVCNWDANGVRLPTEVEWMHAAKEGTDADYLYSGTTNDSANYSWIYYCGNVTHYVKQKTPNALGLYDMTGNVWEWCWDRGGSLPSSGQTNYRGPSSGTNRENKGGCYSSSGQNAYLERRNSTSPQTKSKERGFRVVIVPQ